VRSFGSDVLHKLDEPSLSKLVHDHEHSKLTSVYSGTWTERKCSFALTASLGGVSKPHELFAPSTFKLDKLRVSHEKHSFYLTVHSFCIKNG
jgi:hypothetical protein